MRVLFLGSPPFATPVLAALLKSPWRPTLVVTPEDKPRGRGRRIEPSPIVSMAEAAGIELLHPVPPSGARDASFKDRIRELKPDVIVVASFGELLDQEFLDIALVLNVHGSLLPRHRGASPVQAALLAGDQQTGVSIQRVVLALDAGDVLHHQTVEITPNDTAGDLFERLAAAGGPALLEALAQVDAGTAIFTPQDPDLVTHCRKIKKDAGKVDWNLPAKQLECLVRAMSPWPSAACKLADGRVLKIHRSQLGDMPVPEDALPGEILEASSRLIVATGEGALELLDVQLAGKRAMCAADFLRGQSLQPGAHLAT